MNKFNKSVVVSGEKVIETIRAFNELGVNEYEFVELGLGKSELFCVAFRCNKKTFYKFISKVRVEYISSR